MNYQLQHETDRLRVQASGMQSKLDRITAPISDTERRALEAAQCRFDSVGAYTGARASAPIPGETSLDYRKRLLAPLAGAHDRYKQSRLGPLDSAMLATVEEIVYADAVSNAKQVPAGTLKAVQERDAAGRLVTRFFGDCGVWMQHYSSPGAVGTFNRNPVPKS